MKVTLDGKAVDFADKAELFNELNKGGLVIAFEINGESVDLSTEIKDGDKLAPIYYESDQGKHIFWHTSAHIMAQAIKRIYKDVKLAIGPAIEHGFYYDIDTEAKITEEDFPKLEAEFKKIVKEISANT